MKTFDEIVSERRSVRHYAADKKVEKELIEQLIHTALEAPSWKNKQTGRYYVVMSAEMKDRLRDCLWSQNQLTVKNASALIVTTFVRGVVGFESDGTPSNELGDGWGVYDLGLQNAFFLLKATELGLDSIVLGLRDAKAIKDLLEIPDNEVVVSVIGLGYRSKDALRPKRKTVEEVARFY